MDQQTGLLRTSKPFPSSFSLLIISAPAEHRKFSLFDSHYSKLPTCLFILSPFSRTFLRPSLLPQPLWPLACSSSRNLGIAHSYHTTPHLPFFMLASITPALCCLDFFQSTLAQWKKVGGMRVLTKHSLFLHAQSSHLAGLKQVRSAKLGIIGSIHWYERHTHSLSPKIFLVPRVVMTPNH